MPQLKFTIAADWQEVVKLKTKIDELKSSIADIKTSMTSFDVNKNPLKAKELSTQLSDVTSKLRESEREVTNYGVKLGTDLKSQIYKASQSVNSLSGDIIKQKDIIRQTKDDVQQLSDKYKSMSKYDAGASSVKAQLNSAKAALNEQKYALGDLQSEQAKARLSVKGLNDEFKLMGVESGASVSTIANKIASLSAVAVAGIGIKDVIGQIISVRGDFETIETSIGVLLDGNKGKTQAVMNEIKQYSLVSPLTVKDMSGAIQMMMGFGLQVDDSMKYLKALGDISMGNSTKFNSLTLAFSQMSAAGKLMGQDLNQMINAGFNPLLIISEKTGKSVGDLKQEMEKGAISSQMVQQAFIDATSAGGKFYGMSAAGAKTVNGQISMLKDSFQLMFDNIGTKGEGVILGSIKGATSLVNNYENVGRVIAEVTAVYGTYKAAEMVVLALESLHAAGIGSLTVAEKVHYAWLVLTDKAQKMLNATMLANPYVLVAVAVAAAGVAMYEYARYLDDTSRKTKDFNEQLAAQTDHENKIKDAINKYLPVAQDAKAKTEDRKKAIEALKKIYPSYFASLNIETSKNYSLAESLKEVARQHYNVLKMKELEAKADFAKTVKAEKQARQAANTTTTGGSSITGAVQMGGYEQASLTRATKERQSQANLLWVIGQARRQAGLDLMKVESKTAPAVNYQSAKKAAKDDYEKYTREYNKLKNSKTATVQQVSDAKAKADSAKSTYDTKFGGKEDEKAEKDAKTAEKKRETASERERKQRLAIADAKSKQKQDISNANIDLDKKLSDAEITNEENENNKKLLQLEKSHKDEIDTINKNQREYLQKKVSDAKAVYKAGGSKGSFNASSVTLSADEEDKYNQLRYLSDLKYQKDKDKLQEADQKDLNDFYSKYGTYEQKKLAITQDYEKRIADASSEGMKMSLTKQMNDALSELTKQKIDFSALFSDITNVSDTVLKEIAKQLQDMLDNSKSMAITDIKDIAEKLQQVKDQLGKKNDWFYSPALQKFKDAKANQKEAQSIYNQASAGSALASTELQFQQSTVSGALSSVGINVAPESIKSSDKDKLTKGLDPSSLKKVNAEFDKLSRAEQKSTSAKTKEIDASNNLFDANKKLKENTMDFHKKMGIAAEALNSFNEKLKNLPALIDELGLGNTGVGKAVNKGLNAANDAAGAMADYAKGDYIGAAAKGISAIKNVGSMLGIGGGNGAETEKKISELTKSNEYLKESIDGLTKKIEESSGAAAVTAGTKALDAQKNVEKNNLGILDAQMNYHDSHHSNAAKWDLSSASMNTLINDKELNAPWLQNTWDSFKKLTADQMGYIRTNYAGIWDEMINQGWYGDTFKGAWENYADQAGKLKEITNEINKSLTQVSFDDLYNSFVDSLMDMKKSAQDWADDFSNYLMKAVLQIQVDNEIKPKLQKWYDDFAKAMSDDNLTSTEKADLTKEWNDIVELGKQKRDIVASATGYDTNSAATATKETSVSASQDSVSEANGRMTAIEEVLVDSKSIVNLNLSEMKLANNNLGKMVINSDSIRDILNDSHAEICGIHRDTTTLTDLVDIIKPIKEMKKGIDLMNDKLKTL